MLFLLFLFTAFEDGLNIAWAHTGSKSISSLWHKTGFAIRMLYFISACLLFFPWGGYLLVPPLLFDFWHGIVLSLLLSVLFGKYYYDWIINATRNKFEGTDFNWSYCGSKDQKFWRAEFYIFNVLTILWLLFGGYFVTWVNS
jgi:hypothetical protein